MDVLLRRPAPDQCIGRIPDKAPDLFGDCDADSGTKEALTHEDLFWNYLQSQKRSKLRALASRQSDPALQADAQRVLHLEVIFYALLGVGMLLMALGAASMSAT